MADATKVINKLSEMLAGSQRELAIALCEIEELRDAATRNAIAAETGSKADNISEVG